MEHIDDDTYEITMEHARIVYDLAIQIWFWVYPLAKLCMLEFYYDFLVKFFVREKFELSQMDTDSLYFAINGTHLEDILKPDITVRKQYFSERF